MIAPSHIRLLETALPTIPLPSLVPTLNWPSLDSSYSRVDLDHFPSPDAEYWRHSCGEFGAWSECFIAVVRGARERIWLIDGFLLKIDAHAKGCFVDVFERVLGETSAWDVRLLTSGKEGHRDQIDLLRVLQDQRRAPPRNEGFTLKVRYVRDGKSRARLPHDRFSIIDDELWHWGANVGGTHHEVNAFSRGWSAQESQAVVYFERLWNEAEVWL